MQFYVTCVIDFEMHSANRQHPEELALTPLQRDVSGRHRTKLNSDLPSFLRLSPSPVTSPEDALIANGASPTASAQTDVTSLLVVTRTRSGDDSSHDAGDEASPISKCATWNQLTSHPNGDALASHGGARRKQQVCEGGARRRTQNQTLSTHRLNVSRVETASDASTSSCDAHARVSGSDDVDTGERHSMLEFAERYFNAHPVTHRRARNAIVRTMSLVRRSRRKVRKCECMN